MKLPSKRENLDDISINDLYAFKIKQIWKAVKQEPISFWGITAYFFFEYVRPQVIYPILESVPWAQLSLIVAILGAFSDKSVKWVPHTYNKIFFSYFGIIILSSVFAFKPAAAFASMSVMVNWLIIYLLIINILNTEKRFFIFMLGYLIFNYKMSQHGFFAWASRGFSYEQWGLAGPGGWFGNSSEFAIQMLIAATLSGAFVIALKSHWGRYKKWFFYFMPFAAVMCVLGASSRGAQLALLAIGMVMVMRSKAGFKVFMFLLVIMVAGYFMLPEDQMQRFSEMGEDNNSRLRLAYWSYALEVIGDHPILGVGYSNWLSYARYDMPMGITQGRIQLPHNIFLEAAAELGIVGSICLILLIVYSFIFNARTRKLASSIENRFLYFQTFGLDFGLVGYMVAGCFVTVLYYPFFWVQIAMTVALNNVARTAVEKNRTSLETKVESTV